MTNTIPAGTKVHTKTAFGTDIAYLTTAYDATAESIYLHYASDPTSSFSIAASALISITPAA